MYVLNSVPAADEEAAAAGEWALDVLVDAFDAETGQIASDEPPQKDPLAFGRDHDIDGFVIGIRKRPPTGKVLFGSTTQDVLLETDRPVLTVPVDRLKRDR